MKSRRRRLMLAGSRKRLKLIPGGDWTPYIHWGNTGGITVTESGTITISFSNSYSSTYTTVQSLGCNSEIDFSKYTKLTYTMEVTKASSASGGYIKLMFGSYQTKDASYGKAQYEATDLLTNIGLGTVIHEIDISEWDGVGYLGSLCTLWHAVFTATIKELTLS